MKRCFIILLCLSFFVSSCSVPFREEAKRAEVKLQDILSAFSISDGFVYHNGEDAEHPLTDAMLERMFMEARLDDLSYVCSMAVYFSRRYHAWEIIIFELYDMSHREAVMKLLEKRARKKENAVVFANGVYVYLICTEQNGEIKNFLLS